MSISGREYLKPYLPNAFYTEIREDTCPHNRQHTIDRIIRVAEHHDLIHNGTLDIIEDEAIETYEIQHLVLYIDKPDGIDAEEDKNKVKGYRIHVHKVDCQ